ncbi:hypothetical protein EXIGLDRAFT_722537 [Exidia glandulosa HHB12029]|uniref:Uncharacterized protein n=1 Tax=Exidia glandulosa HHB12029 TaxID=1314781 RepID=A0A165F9V3_EXIGL|nr:hypothetical protein EXIGLDRAFT_722537 [Exidia glandulosa HHB12029]
MASVSSQSPSTRTCRNKNGNAARRSRSLHSDTARNALDSTRRWRQTKWSTSSSNSSNSMSGRSWRSARDQQ